MASLVSGEHWKSGWRTALDNISIYNSQSPLVKGSRLFFIRVCAVLVSLSMGFSILTKLLIPDVIDIVGIIAVATVTPITVFWALLQINKSFKVYGEKVFFAAIPLITLIILLIGVV